jgi:predicted RNA-binding Zn-ribbon protein involved in translation (DUF1610 family)
MTGGGIPNLDPSRQDSYADVEEDALHRMMEMAGQSKISTSESSDYEKAIPPGTDDNYVKFKCPHCGTATKAGLMRGNNYVCPSCNKPLPAKNQMPLGEEDNLSRMMEMAGVKKKEVDEEKTEEGNLFTKGLADNDIKVGEKIPGTNAVKKKDIDEGILASTRALWKKYQE